MNEAVNHFKKKNSRSDQTFIRIHIYGSLVRHARYGESPSYRNDALVIIGDFSKFGGSHWI